MLADADVRYSTGCHWYDIFGIVSLSTYVGAKSCGGNLLCDWHHVTMHVKDHVLCRILGSSDPTQEGYLHCYHT